MSLLVVSLLCLAVLPISATSLETVRSLVKEGRVVEALREIEQLEAHTPTDPNIQFEIGEILQELGASRAETLERLAPDSPQVHELVGRSLESHNKLAEALAEYQVALKQDPKMPGLHFLVGNIYRKQQDLNSAKPAFEAELRLNPNHGWANLRMGQLMLSMDSDAPQNAITYFQKAIPDPLTSLEAHRELGKALRMQGRFREALQELRLFARARPDDSAIHAQLAAVYRGLGDTRAVEREAAIERRILKKNLDSSINVRQNDSDH